MYITIKSIKKTLGKYIEMTDLYIGLPILMLFLTMFSFLNLRFISLIFLTIRIFILIPIQLSNKNRMYKVIGLIFKFLFRNKKFIYQEKGKVNNIGKEKIE